MSDTPTTDTAPTLQEIEVTINGIPVTMQVDENDKGKYEHLIGSPKAQTAPENKAAKASPAKA